MSGPVHAFLAGTGRDGAGRRLSDVIAFDDARIEGVHDFIQWCFPLREASLAVPDAPVLTRTEAEAIRADAAAQDGLKAATARMARFYEATDGWLRAYDHNHLRITRILSSLRDLVGHDAAKEFDALVMRRVEAAGIPVNAESLGFWDRALGC